MKYSNYNLFYEFNLDKEKIIAYNSCTNALALMTKENYNKLINTNPNDLCEDKEFSSKLIAGGYLINDDFDELAHLSFNLLKDRYSTKGLGLTIAPTIDCNFDCIYCYQKDGKDTLYMSKDVQDKILDFVREKVKYIDDLAITWYGGEPLLNMKAIEYMSKEFIRICNKNNINYQATMVTNGYNLTENICKKLEELKIGSLQVTIDGLEDVHDKRRPLVGGQGTFKRILKNIKICTKYCNSISLRVNIDKENMSKTNELLEYLRKEEITKCVSVYIAKVENSNDCYDKSICLKSQNFSELKLEVNNSLIEIEGYPEMINYPNLMTNSCLADSIHGYLIDPKGHIYKCWSDIGFEERIVGTLVGDSNLKLNRKLFDQYMLYNVTEDTECKECKVLPICMGGCPRKRVDNENRCSDFKFNLEKSLQLTAVKLENKAKEKLKCSC